MIESWTIKCILPKEIVNIIKKYIIEYECGHTVYDNIKVCEDFALKIYKVPVAYDGIYDDITWYYDNIFSAKGIERVHTVLDTKQNMIHSIEYMLRTRTRTINLVHYRDAYTIYRKPKRNKYYHPNWLYVELYIDLPKLVAN